MQPVEERDAEGGRVEHVRALTRLLDEAIPIPGTGYRFGLDPIIGLIPGLGDVVGGAMSGYIVLVAARLGAPKVVLLRMLLNVGVDTLLGAFPFLGDLFDAAWKSNTRNLDLLQRHVDEPGSAEAASRGVVVAVLGGIVLTVVAAVVLTGWLIAMLLAALV
ncbi:MAG: DUF4112 domain-containing protein [Gemmatimonadaceae bacterium]